MRQQREMPVIRKARKRVRVRVPDADDMDDETFLKHVEKRHAVECKIEGFLTRHSVPRWVKCYRAYHARLHRLAYPGQHDHVHEEDF